MRKKSIDNLLFDDFSEPLVSVEGKAKGAGKGTMPFLMTPDFGGVAFKDIPAVLHLIADVSKPLGVSELPCLLNLEADDEGVSRVQRFLDLLCQEEDLSNMGIMYKDDKLYVCDSNAVSFMLTLDDLNLRGKHSLSDSVGVFCNIIHKVRSCAEGTDDTVLNYMMPVVCASDTSNILTLSTPNNFTVSPVLHFTDLTVPSYFFPSSFLTTLHKTPDECIQAISNNYVLRLQDVLLPSLDNDLLKKLAKRGLMELGLPEDVDLMHRQQSYFAEGYLLLSRDLRSSLWHSLESNYFVFVFNHHTYLLPCSVPCDADTLALLLGSTVYRVSSQGSNICIAALRSGKGGAL